MNNLHGMPAVFAGICAGIAHAAIDEDGKQCGMQLAAVAISFVIAVLGGVVTGVAIRPFNRPQEELYSDDPEWMVPDLELLEMNGNNNNKVFTDVVLDNMADGWTDSRARCKSH